MKRSLSPNDRERRRTLAIVLAITVAAPSAMAQAPRPTKKAPPKTVAPPPVVTAPARPSLADTLTGPAKDDYMAGRLLFGDHDYGGALVKFQSAYTQSKDARLLFNMAACEKNLCSNDTATTPEQASVRPTARRSSVISPSCALSSGVCASW